MESDLERKFFYILGNKKGMEVIEKIEELSKISSLYLKKGRNNRKKCKLCRIGLRSVLEGEREGLLSLETKRLKEYRMEGKCRSHRGKGRKF